MLGIVSYPPLYDAPRRMYEKVAGVVVDLEHVLGLVAFPAVLLAASVRSCRIV